MTMKKLIGNRQFYIATISIAFPIILQQFVTSFVNLIDNIMIGNVGSNALTAVTISNRIYLIFNSTLFGLCGAAGIFIAQYYGANNHKNCQKILNINIVSAFISACLFVLALITIPRQLVGIFTSNETVIKESLRYIQFAMLAYIPYAISDSIMMAFRSVGINKIQLVVGFISMCINTLLNYIMIFGNLGCPALGVQGAAIATTIARTTEMIIYLILLKRQHHYFQLDVKGLFHIDLSLIRSMLKKAVPLTINEIMFSLALATVFLSYTRCDGTLIPALSVVDTVMQVAYIIFSGLSSAVSILIGKRLGANQLTEAKDNSIKLITFGVMVGIVISLCIYILAPYIADFYNVESYIKEHIIILLKVKGILLPIYVYNVCIFFILRAGGDTLSTLIMDSGFLWCFHVLLSTVISIFFEIPLIYLYIFIESLDLIKMLVSTYFYKKGHWIKNMTA